MDVGNPADHGMPAVRSGAIHILARNLSPRRRDGPSVFRDTCPVPLRRSFDLTCRRTSQLCGKISVSPEDANVPSSCFYCVAFVRSTSGSAGAESLWEEDHVEDVVQGRDSRRDICRREFDRHRTFPADLPALGERETYNRLKYNPCDDLVRLEN